MSAVVVLFCEYCDLRETWVADAIQLVVGMRTNGNDYSVHRWKLNLPPYYDSH